MPGISRLRLAAWGATGSNKMTPSIAKDASPALRGTSGMPEVPRGRHLLRARDLADERDADVLSVHDMAREGGLSRSGARCRAASPARSS